MCLNVAMCGCRGCMDLGVHGYLDVRMFGCRGVRLQGSMDLVMYKRSRICLEQATSVDTKETPGRVVKSRRKVQEKA